MGANDSSFHFSSHHHPKLLEATTASSWVLKMQHQHKKQTRSLKVPKSISVQQQHWPGGWWWWKSYQTWHDFRFELWQVKTFVCHLGTFDDDLAAPNKILVTISWPFYGTIIHQSDSLENTSHLTNGPFSNPVFWYVKFYEFRQQLHFPLKTNDDSSFICWESKA